MLAEQRMSGEAVRGRVAIAYDGLRRSTERGGKMTGTFRTFFMLVGVSAIVVVVFLIVASAM